MKKLLLMLSTALMLTFTGCMQFDDTRIWDAIDELEDLYDDLDGRLEKLEEECEKMNTNIEALQTLVSALQSQDTITTIAPIKQGDEIIGYTISFSKSEPITIYHGEDGKDGADGEDGKDGYTPTIGVAKDADENYYWTLDGEWLLDAEGNKIKANGNDGEDGADGENGANGEDGKDGENGADGEDGITPKLEIRDGYWYISYDNGQSWVELGKATGEDGKDGANGADGEDGKDGDSLFQSVTWDDEYAYFTLSDGTVIKIPLALDSEAEEGDLPPANEIWYTSTDGEVVTPDATDVFGANIVSNTYENGKGVITFDGDVTSIGDYAFAGCESLASVTIPEGITEIGEDAFLYCESLVSINIPNSVTSIGKYAFAGCLSLASINIPDSVTSIGIFAFADCGSLVEFKGKFASEDGRCIVVDGELKAFASAGLTEYIIPEGVTSIGKSVFAYKRLASVTIPNSVTSIGKYAFEGCLDLLSITIPEGVTYIGDAAFYDCESLAEVYCKATTPPSLGVDAFYNNASECKIYVPTESVDAYKKASYWSDYADYIEPYNFGGGEGNAGVKEVAAVSLFGFYYEIGYNFYLIGGYVSSGEDVGYDVPMDSWNYGFDIISDTEPVNDEIPLGTYTYVDFEKLESGEEELKTGIFTKEVEGGKWCMYVDANGEMQEYKYTEGTMVVSEGKIELTVTLDNGEVHHVVYEGSLQTWGEAA